MPARKSRSSPVLAPNEFRWRTVTGGSSYKSDPRPPEYLARSQGRLVAPMPLPVEAALLRYTHLVVDGPVGFGPYLYHIHMLVVPNAGRYACVVNDQALSLEPGQALLVVEGDRHGEPLLPPGTEYHTVDFRLVGADPAYERLLRPEASPAARVFAAPPEWLGQVLPRLAACTAAFDLPNQGLAWALAQELLWTTVAALPRPAVNPLLLEPVSRRFFLTHLENYLAENLRRNLSLADIAHALHMSERNLTLRCRAETGNSPLKLFTLRRVQRAQELLRQSALSIAEIAEYMRFSTPYHFSAVFKRVTGLSPQAYRRKMA